MPNVETDRTGDPRSTAAAGRRRLIRWFAAAGLSLAGAAPLRALTPTPRQTAGPFYPSVPPLDDDNDLTRVRGRIGTARGVIADVLGRVVDVNGVPIAGAEVKIWQCDANGRYRHPLERSARPIDPSFQGYGRVVTDELGRYRFRTIKPVPYPGRAPHIHFSVTPPRARALVTQMYAADSPENQWDFILNRLPTDQRAALIVEFAHIGKASGAARAATFDIVLAPTGGTPSTS